MAMPAVDHLLRTLAAVAPGQRVLLRGATGEGSVARPLARLGFEVHAAPWDDAAARGVLEAVGGEHASEGPPQAAPVYAAAAPVHALPYPEAHFAWVVMRVPELEDASEEERTEVLVALLEEARHHLQPGGWVFVLAPAGPVFTGEGLGKAAAEAGLAEAEAPDQSGEQMHAIYRRVEEGTPP